MPVAGKIQIEDFKTALADKGVELTINSTVPDTDDATPFLFNILESFIDAQKAQNDAVGDGEKVQVASANPNSRLQEVEYPVGSGKSTLAETKVYTMTARVIKQVVGTVVDLI